MNKFEREQGRRLMQGMMDRLSKGVEDDLMRGAHGWAADFGQQGGDHTAFVKYWVDRDGVMHIEDIRTEEVYERKLHFPRTLGRTVLDECRITLANRPYTCPVRETRHFTMCHDGMRRDKRTKQWQTCEICQGFGLIE